MYVLYGGLYVPHKKTRFMEYNARVQEDQRWCPPQVENHITEHMKILQEREVMKNGHSSADTTFKKQDNVRVRYAPSPTGLMHLGGLRTALFNYLFAKRHGGTFLLRIEDTDQTRYVEGSAQNLDDCLAWAGIPYDEGPKRPIKDIAPYVQNGSAYRCFCSPERLASLRVNSKNKGPVSLYDRACLKLPREEVDRRVANGESHTVRLKIPNTETYTKFNDIVKGNVQFNNQMIDDQILMKSDGFPTYHLASVVDDHLMKISHVIRGEEWLNSTPKHIILYEAFGWKAPVFAHVPLLLNTDKSKLSKRQGDVSVDSYIERVHILQDFQVLLKPFFVAPDFTSETSTAMKAKIWKGDTSVDNITKVLSGLESIGEQEFVADTIYKSLQRYGLPLNTCFDYQFYNFINITLDQDQQTALISYYNNENCTGLISASKYSLSGCSSFSFEDQSSPNYATFSIASPPVYTPKTLLWDFFYTTDDDCSGAFYTTTYTNHLHVDSIMYECDANNLPVVSSCYNHTCTPIPWGESCIPGSQGGPALLSCAPQ
eukprot:gene12199-14277_t